MDLSIVPECFVETNLIETLVPPTGKGYNHQKGCGTVARTMKNSLGDEFALGIVDKDKKELDYLKEFDEVKNTGSLVLHKHKNKNHYIIQICPVIEKFIFKAAEATGLSVVDYDLPSDLEQFKKESKTEQSKKDVRFRNLFKALRRAGAPDFLTLAQWVEYLKSNPYSADLDYLRSL